MHDFKIKQARLASLILNNTYNLRPKLHDTKFIYHFITTSGILKSKIQLHKYRFFLNLYKYGPVLVSL